MDAGERIRTGLSVAGAIAARWYLASTAGALLSTRIELSNAFTGIRGLREGLALIRLGKSPYVGSAFHAPPLLLHLFAPVATPHSLSVLPCILADAASATLLLLLGRRMHAARHPGVANKNPAAALKSLLQPSGLPAPATMAALLLWNPLLIATAAAASTASLALAAALLAVYGAVANSAVVAALGAAVATYLRPHNILFVVPLTLLLLSGPEDLTAEPTDAALAAAHVVADARAPPQRRGGRPRRPRRLGAALAFWGALLLFAAALVLLSDIAVVRSETDCASWGEAAERVVMRGLAAADDPLSGIGAILRIARSKEAEPGAAPAALNAASDWISEAYLGIWQYSDLSVNIGLWWYFLVEMFQEFQAFFRFVLHAQCCIFTLPLAVRFQHRPLFTFFLQAMLTAIFQPYPLVADAALYLSLLPLFLPHLRRAQIGLFLGLLLLLAAFLGPATYHQWIHTGAANANFYYAATLVWAGAQVALLLLFVGAIVDCDRILAGKPLQFRLRAPDEK